MDLLCTQFPIERISYVNERNKEQESTRLFVEQSVDAVHELPSSGLARLINEMCS